MSDLAVVLVIILILVLIWRGPKTLPLLGQAFGRGVKEARKEASEFRASTEPEADAETAGTATADSDQPGTPPAPKA
jgi:Sec-independent protein translocase protein TatA